MTWKQTAFSRDEIHDHLTQFDLGSWQDYTVETALTPDRARFYHLNTPQIFPHAVIHRSGPVSELVREVNDEIGEFEVEVDGKDISLDRFIESDAVDGVIAVRKGKIIYERYPRMRAFDKHFWWSVSKSFAGALIGLLEEEGGINLNNPIDMYVPELKGSGYEGVSVRDVVDMASGIDVPEMDDPEAYAAHGKSRYAQFESPFKTMPCSDSQPSAYEALKTFQSAQQPGMEFQYTSSDTFACSWLIERVLGAPYHEIIREQFWSKIGPEADAHLLVGPDGTPFSHGGFSTTLTDLARFGLLFTPSWNTVSQEKIIPEQHISRIQSGGRPEIFMKLAAGKFWTDLLGEELSHNIYQWDFVTKDGDFFKGGWGAQGLYISPRRDFVFAFFSHNNSAAPLTKFARRLAAAI